MFAQAGIDTFDTDEDIEACVDVLSDESLRARFGVLLKQFLTTLDIVLPRLRCCRSWADARRHRSTPRAGPGAGAPGHMAEPGDAGASG